MAWLPKKKKKVTIKLKRNIHVLRMEKKFVCFLEFGIFFVMLANTFCP